MPSAAVLKQKTAVVEGLAEQLKGSIAGVLVDYHQITVEDDTKLRKQLREAGVEYKVIKNTLISKACDIVGFEGLKPSLNGMTAIAISKDDPIVAAKILCAYAKDHENFSVKAGYLEGEVIDAESVTKLAEMPSKEILIAKLLGTLNAPLTGLVTVLNGNIRGLAVVLKAIADKQSA